MAARLITAADGYCGIGAGSVTAGNLFESPINSIVLRNDHRCQIAATSAGNDGGAIRPHLHVTVNAETTQSISTVDLYARPKGQAAIVAAGTERRRHNVLRAIVDCIGISDADQRRMKRTTTHRLVIDARRYAATLTWDPRVAVIVGVRRQAVLPGKLRCQRSSECRCSVVVCM